MGNNPTNWTDPSGEIGPIVLAILAAAWIAYEIGGSAYDAYTTAETLADPCASIEEKAAISSLFLIGLAAPGSGWTAGGKAAYKIAKAGGKHAGLLKNYSAREVSEIRKALTSYERRVSKHRAKIANPAEAVEDWATLFAQEQAGLLGKWEKDAFRNQELAGVMRGLLDKLGALP